MKKCIFVFSICVFLFGYNSLAQKTYLAGIYHDTPINSTCEEFQQNILQECRYLGEYYIADFEESPCVYDERVDTYLVDDVWGHGRAHVYVRCQGGQVKLVYMEFPWGDASKLGSEPVAVYTWGAMEIFPKYCGYGSPSDKGNEWESVNNATRYCQYSSWYLSDGVKLTIKCWWRWPGNPYKEFGDFEFKGSQARTEIIYEVL